MLNVTELKVAMIRRNKRNKDLCKILGISPASLTLKMQGKRNFSLEQAQRINEAFNLTEDEKNRIFFAK